MTLHQLKIFLAVASHRNVTRASQELRITQSAVSRQLRALAEECGARLYRVSSGGIELTDNGQVLLERARWILKAADELTGFFGAKRRERSLRIAGAFSTCISFVPLLSALFRRAHDGLHVTVKSGTTREVETWVLNGEADVGVVTSPPCPPSLRYEFCRKQEVLVFCSVKHPLAGKPAVTLEEMARAPVVVGKRSAPEFEEIDRVLRAVEDRGLRLNEVMECDSAEGVRFAVRAGAGLGVLYADLLEPDLRRNELKALRVAGLKAEIESFFVWAKERPLSRNAQAFLDLARRWLEESRQRATQLRMV
jgi:DNA-binding transcriptional LysR family regulator